MIKQCILCTIVILLCVTIGVAQSKRKSSPQKSAVVTYQSEGREQGMYKWGTMYLKINGEVKLFYWNDRTRISKSISNSSKAYEKGAEWRITYSVNPDSGVQAEFYLLSATFTGRVRK